MLKQSTESKVNSLMAEFLSYHLLCQYSPMYSGVS